LKALYSGKTKAVLADEQTGELYLFFKDDITGEGGAFDPGANTVAGSVTGKGERGLAIAKHFLELMEANGIPTHYLGADIHKKLMKVRKLTIPALEFVLRYFTAGSMCRRFSLEPGVPFDPPYAEVTLKDDAQNDPLISERLCVMKGLLNEGEYQRAIDLLITAGEILQKELGAMGLDLIDFKLEFGFDEDRNIYIADEISPDIWRVRDEAGNIPDQAGCAALVLKKISE
jgi:phosphoribosylaminoimidazole-succinocarboxamide synthase